MPVSTVTPKGRVVIPAELRRKYKIEAPSSLDGSATMPAASRSFAGRTPLSSPGGSNRAGRRASLGAG